MPRMFLHPRYDDLFDVLALAQRITFPTRLTVFAVISLWLSTWLEPWAVILGTLWFSTALLARVYSAIASRPLDVGRVSRLLAILLVWVSVFGLWYALPYLTESRGCEPYVEYRSTLCR